MLKDLKPDYTFLEQETIRLSAEDFPQAGMLFTNYVKKYKRHPDNLVLLGAFPGIVGHVQNETYFYPVPLVDGTSFRFLISTVSKNETSSKVRYHAIPFRPLLPTESRRRAILLPNDVRSLKEAAQTRSIPRLEDFIIENDLNWIQKLPPEVIPLLP